MADRDAASAGRDAAPAAVPSDRQTSSPIEIPALARASSSSALEEGRDSSAPSAEPKAASFTSSSSSAASAPDLAARLRRDSSLKIFLPADDLALKAILSPPLVRKAPSPSSSSSPSDPDEPRLQKSRSASAVGTAAGHLFDKLLFRSPGDASNSSSSNSSSHGTSDASPGTRAKTSTGSLGEEDLEPAEAGVVIRNTSLPPPPFANMFACDSCREDIGSLLSKGRHHCRNCGGSFCADCSSRTAVVPFQAYLGRGELRVCDACFHRIQNFQAQVQSTQVTWGGLAPPPSDDVRRAFKLPADEDAVTIFNCSLFLDITPFYGHLFLTRRHFCFLPYALRTMGTMGTTMGTRTMGTDNVDVSSSYAVPSTPHAPRALKVPYERIVSLVKPQFYYINGLQVKTDAKQKFFLAEFNGLRDMCFLRLDQLIRARQQRPGTSKLAQQHHHHHHHHHAQHNVQSTEDLTQQAMVRRKSYRKLAADGAGAAAAPGSAACSSSSSTALTAPVDVSDVLNFASQQSSVGFFDIDDADLGGSGEFATDAGDLAAGDEDDDTTLLRSASASIVEGDEMDEDGAGSSADCSHASSSEDGERFEPLAPDEPLERMTILLDCELRADVKQVFDLLFNDDVGRAFTVANLERARDVDIGVTPWRAIGEREREAVGRGAVVSTERDYAMVRVVTSKHPPKTSFPGLPAYAECEHTQRFRLDASSHGGDKWDRFVVSDVHRMQKIPFCDYFEIETRWVFSRDGERYCHVQVGLVVNFLKATWFKSQIASSTKSESKDAFEQWAKQAAEHLAAHQQRLGAAASSSASAPLEHQPSSSSSSPSKTRTRVGISTVRKSSSAEPAIARAWTSAAASTAAGGGADADAGVAADLRGLLAPLAASSYTQWVVLALLLYCLVVIRGQQLQIQQLASTTALLLDQLQQGGATQSQPAPQTTAAIRDACAQQVLDGARRALEQFFRDASA